MFSATRVAVTVAILALVGGLAYVAVPTGQQAPIAGAPVRDPADFAGFSGTFSAVPCKDGLTTDFDWGQRVEGDYCSSMWLEVSDERLSGAARAVHNAVRFENGPIYGVRTLSAEIDNEGGTWEGTGLAFHDPNENIMRYEFLLSGREGYDGLSAMLSLVSDHNFLGHEAQGVIFPGELPPYPVLEGVEEPAEWIGEIDPTDFAGLTGQVVVPSGTWGEKTATDWGLEVRGNHYEGIEVDVSDPRLAGEQETLVNYDSFLPGGSEWGVRTTANRIVNEGGSWVGTSTGYQHPETTALHYVNVYRGVGDHEGLGALFVLSQDEFGFWLDADGVVFPGELPPYPEPPPAE